MADVRFHASLHSTRMDAEGESKVTLTVPLSDLPALVRLALCTQQVLLVTVTTEVAA